MSAEHEAFMVEHRARMAWIERYRSEELPKLRTLALKVAAEYEEHQAAHAEEQRLEELLLDRGVPFPGEEKALQRLEKRMRRDGELD